MARGVHGNHVRGSRHYRWRGGNPRPDPEKRRANARASAKRYPERRRAREKVKDAVRAGVLPSVKSQRCVDCGLQAQAYDHAFGYDRPLDVEPVCYKCHGKRSRKRGEHKRRVNVGLLYEARRLTNGANVHEITGLIKMYEAAAGGNDSASRRTADLLEEQLELYVKQLRAERYVALPA